MTTVTRVDGAPGAGKTYTLRQQLERRKSAGLYPTDVNWITFTRAGTEDAVETVKDVFPDLTDDDTEMGANDVARTFHSLTLSLLLRTGLVEFDHDIDPDPVIVQGTYDADEVDPFAEFCEQKGLSYDADSSDTKQLLSGETEQTPPGNKFFAINDFLNQTCKPPSKHWDAPVETSIPNSEIEQLLEEWDEFKRAEYDHRVFEFADYVHYAYEEGVTPDVELLLIDEFQDFTPAEYRLYKQWRDTGAIDEIVLAGDPQQSIYSFRGGSPLYFEETDRDEEVDLSKSYRCPKPVVDAARQILDGHPQTAARGFNADSDAGQIRSLTTPTAESLSDDLLTAARRVSDDPDTPRVMLLTRTNSQLSRVSRTLRSVGVPFDILGSRRSLWEYGDLTPLLEFFNSYPDPTGYDMRRLELLFDKLQSSVVADIDTSSRIGETLPAERAHAVLSRYDGVEDIVGDLDLPEWQSDALAAAVDAPADLSPDDVKIGTIHTAKGLEASAVYLFAEATGRIVENYERDENAAAEEHRVWYVGTTRAAEELTLVDGYFNGPTAPPVECLRLSGVVS